MSDISILCVGLVCVDIVQVCKEFPKEDSDQRCLECYPQRGGNASNNCTVLSMLGAKSEFFGTLGNSFFLEFLKEDFKKYNINIDNCILKDCDIPLSTVLINSENGSRTIVHYNKNLIEITMDDFSKLNLSQYTWIHFEGRGFQELQKILPYVENWRNLNKPSLKISIELEKERSVPELSKFVDVVFIGKDYAISKGWADMDQVVANMINYIQPRGTIVCGWGTEGAIVGNANTVFKSKCYPPSKVVNSLGAGDTLVAGFIYSLSKGTNLSDSLTIACRLAGAKVGFHGFSQLEQASKLIF